MIYNSVSAKEVIGRISTKYRFQSSDWIANAPMWIFEGLNALGNYNALVKTSQVKTIKDFKTEMPCDLVAIYAIEHNGQRLAYSGDTTHFNQYCEPRTTDMIPADGTVIDIITDPSQGAANVVSSELYKTRGHGYEDGNSYQINPGYIVTSFESGTIKVHFSKYPVGSDGWPLIPDNHWTKEALQWYLVTCILLGGVEHPVVKFEMAESRWNHYHTRAMNYNAYPSLDKMDRLRRTWTRLIPPDHAIDDFFMGMENTEKIITES
jgi:hypothetical protein